VDFTFNLKDIGLVNVRYRVRPKRSKAAGRVWFALVSVLAHDEAQRYIGPWMQRETGMVWAFGLIENDWPAVKARLKKWAEDYEHEMEELHVACFDVNATPAWARSGKPQQKMKGG
jgi:hypothetical protein